MKTWANKRRRQIDDQVRFGERLLRGRTGADRLNATTVNGADDLLIAEVDQFLTGQ